MNSCASSPSLRMSHWENLPTNARCPDKKNYVSSALWYSRITQLDPRSMLHVFELKHEVDRTTVFIEFVGQCVFHIFSSFFFFFFFWGGGGGGLKLRSYCQKIFRLPYLSRIYIYPFSGFEKQLHKNYGTDFHQIWYNYTSYHIGQI